MKRQINFPYAKYKGGFYPIIKIQATGPAGSLETEAYVDTGASVSIFLASFASALGVDYVKGKITYIMIGDGRFIRVYMHKLPIKIGHFAFRANIGISAHLGADFNLLGQKDIFDRFKITFDKRRRTVFFMPY